MSSEEIIYTYNKYALNAVTTESLSVEGASNIISGMQTTKYYIFNYKNKTSAEGATPETFEYYYGGFVWNETTVANVTTYSDIYFVAFGMEAGTNTGDYTITARHFYKCNAGDTKAKFEFFEDTDNEVQHCGFVIEKTIDNTTTKKLVFGFNIKESFFVLPAKSFFLEGDHQPFNGLKAGFYPVDSRLKSN